MDSLKAQLDQERTRNIQLEKNIIEMRHEEQARVSEMEVLKMRLKKTEDARSCLKEQRDVLTVQLAAEKGRVLASEWNISNQLD